MLNKSNNVEANNLHSFSIKGRVSVKVHDGACFLKQPWREEQGCSFTKASLSQFSSWSSSNYLVREIWVK